MGRNVERFSYTIRYCLVASNYEIKKKYYLSYYLLTLKNFHRKKITVYMCYLKNTIKKYANLVFHRCLWHTEHGGVKFLLFIVRIDETLIPPQNLS